MQLSLGQYPAAIAKVSNQILAIDEQIQEFKMRGEAIESGIELVVAFDAELKNDSQRKAKKLQGLQASTHYQQAITALSRLGNDRTDLVNQLEQLRGEFSVAKLEFRAAIAEKLIGLESRDLIGL